MSLSRCNRTDYDKRSRDFINDDNNGSISNYHFSKFSDNVRKANNKKSKYVIEPRKKCYTVEPDYNVGTRT